MVILNVLDENRELIDIVDYSMEVLWTKKFQDVGGVVFKVPADDYTIDLFLNKAWYVTRDDDDMVCEVVKLTLNQSIDSGADELTVTCLSLNNLLKNRQVWEQINLNDTADICIRALVKNNFIVTTEERMVTYIKLGAMTKFGPTIVKQVTEESNVLIAIQEIALAYGIGFKFVMDENKDFVFDLYQGIDRTTSLDPVEFSPARHNLQSFTFELDRSNEKNVAIVVGEGEGINRKKATVGTATGIRRKEMFVDGKNSSSNDGVVTDYQTMLVETGKNILAEHASTNHFNFEVDAQSYVYKEDFDLGDIITVRADYGLSLTAKIVEVIETWYATNEYQIKINVEV